MARKKIRVSSQGMAVCGSCSRHVKFAAPERDPTCPLCGRSMAGGDLRGAIGRGARLMAGLMAFSTAACDTTEDEADPTVMEAGVGGVEGSGGQDGLGGQDGMGGEGVGGVPAPEAGPVPLYGIAPDAGPVPPYGIPPDEDAAVEAPDMAVATPDAEAPDAAADAEVLPPDMGVVPLYGLPPDAGPVPPYGIPPAADAAVDAAPEPDGQVAVPLYGLPPDVPDGE